VNADSTKVERRKLASKPFAKSDRIFFGVARVAAYSSFVIIALILIYLVGRSLPALQKQGLINFTFGSTWNSAATPETFQLGPMLWGSILISIIGVVIAVPLAISIAYFIEFMAPKAIAKAVTTIVDLLAAIPSIVLGLWVPSCFHRSRLVGPRCSTTRSAGFQSSRTQSKTSCAARSSPASWSQ